MKQNVKNPTIIFSDKEETYKSFSKINNTTHISIKSDNKKDKSLQKINSLHSRLKSFLKPFNGVSNIYLKLYLKWFHFLEKINENLENEILERTNENSIVSRLFTSALVGTAIMAAITMVANPAIGAVAGLLGGITADITIINFDGANITEINNMDLQNQSSTSEVQPSSSTMRQL